MLVAYFSVANDYYRSEDFVKVDDFVQHQLGTVVTDYNNVSLLTKSPLSHSRLTAGMSTKTIIRNA